ncbi:MAG: flagellar hook-basal body protein [Eubacteriales bacterium]
MYQGFYNLTSGMLSQTRRLDVISQNMVNVSTTGYRQDIYTDIAYEQVMLSREGNAQETVGTEIGETYLKLVPSDIYTNFDQGPLEPTKLPLDFGIEGDGFFEIEWEGVVGYTRAGSFSLDNDGNLFLPNHGLVHGPDGNNIYLGTDNVYGDPAGNIFNADTGELLGTLGVFQFEDNGTLERNENGLFLGDGAVPAEGYKMYNGYVERANVDLATEMMNMMTAQRALQSASQVFKIYDGVITKAVNEVGRK